MNKKEIAEIRKLFSVDRQPFTRITTCVMREGERILEQTIPFSQLPEEDMFKYFEIFKKSLSGTLGKELAEIRISAQATAVDEFERVRNGGDREALIQELEEIYGKEEEHWIIMVHGAYDITGKGTDGAELFDASEEVYNFVLACICPVAWDKPALGRKEEKIGSRERSQFVGTPELALLYPAFSDRSTDIGHVLCWQKKREWERDEKIRKRFGNLPEKKETQRESFRTMVKQVLGENCTLEAVKEIDGTIREAVEAAQGEYVRIREAELGKILSGHVGEADQESLQEATEMLGEISAQNLVDKKLTIDAGRITIAADPVQQDRIEYRKINDRPCIVIWADEIEVNGIAVKGGLE